MARGNFGERLKRERELREVTLQEITSATRIGPRFLEALENEEWEKLPGGVFNRGFVRSIARYLGLDEEALLGEYDLAHGAQFPVAEENPEQKKSPQSRWKPALIALVLLVLVAGAIYGGFVAWKYYAARRNVKETPAAGPPTQPQPPPAILPTAQEVPTAKPNPPAPSLTGPLDLLVSASADTHLLVLVDGSVAFYDEVHAGQSLRFTAENGFEVTAADAGAVLLQMNGLAMPPLGAPGSSGTIKLSHDDLRQANGGDTKH
jgi:transcriptional regulator with XRE-family HTH domain